MKIFKIGLSKYILSWEVISWSRWAECLKNPHLKQESRPYFLPLCFKPSLALSFSIAISMRAFIMINFDVGNLLSLRESTKTCRPELLSDKSKQVQLLWEIAAHSTVHSRLNRKEHPLQTSYFPPAALLFLSPACFCLSLGSPAKLRWSRRR